MQPFEESLRDVRKEFFFFSSRRRHTRYWRDWRFRRVLFRSVAELRAAGDDEAAEQVWRAPLDPPDALVDEVAVLDVGGREVVLRHLGRGHTGHDLVVEVEDGVVFAGDLVEEGGPPAFEDAFPAEWPATLGRLHALARGPVVPGHGAVVDAAFVGAQREELLEVLQRSEERRVGKECRSRWSAYH